MIILAQAVQRLIAMLKTSPAAPPPGGDGGGLGATAPRRARLSRLAIPLFALALAGCAGRPGPEALSEVDAKRARRAAGDGLCRDDARARFSDANVFTAGRAKEMSYAEFVISIPPGHKPGNIEWPGADARPERRLRHCPPARRSTRPAFEAAVTRKRGGRPPDVGVFVHGYNVNFQEAVFRMAQMAADADADGVAMRVRLAVGRQR